MDKLNIKSKVFGSLLIEPEKVVHFRSGLIGFGEEREYVILGDEPPFCWLQSTSNPERLFLLLNTAAFGDNYKLTPPIGHPAIDLKDTDNWIALVVVTRGSSGSPDTANLRAPIVINTSNRKGVQLLYDDEQIPTHFPLELSSAAT